MRLSCPFCGERDSREFTYKGDATRARPEDEAQMFDYVYLRDNPKGPHQETWLHQPCRTWLVVTRDTVTHQIYSVRSAREKSA